MKLSGRFEYPIPLDHEDYDQIKNNTNRSLYKWTGYFSDDYKVTIGSDEKLSEPSEVS